MSKWDPPLGSAKVKSLQQAYEISYFERDFGLGVRNFWFIIGISGDFLGVVYPSTQWTIIDQGH